jgi:hypothetical protein
MNRDDIMRIAREVWSAGNTYIGPGIDSLELFAALVAAAEREECALDCEKIERRKWETMMHGGTMQGFGAIDCAAAIRARGTK